MPQHAILEWRSLREWYCQMFPNLSGTFGQLSASATRDGPSTSESLVTSCCRHAVRHDLQVGPYVFKKARRES
jgi:hypothetical protein